MRKTRFFYVNVILLVVLLNKMCVYGSIAAGEMKEHRSEPEIRVVLTDSDFQSVYHDSVTISLDEEETVYEAKILHGRREIISIPEQENGISIPSINRQCGMPVYSGRMEIRPCEEGLLLINILPLEEYLKAVVPSEMPSAYEMEALKAQAVCARTVCMETDAGLAGFLSMARMLMTV